MPRLSAAIRSAGVRVGKIGFPQQGWPDDGRQIRGVRIFRNHTLNSMRPPQVVEAGCCTKCTHGLCCEPGKWKKGDVASDGRNNLLYVMMSAVRMPAPTVCTAGFTQAPVGVGSYRNIAPTMPTIGTYAEQFAVKGPVRRRCCRASPQCRPSPPYRQVPVIPPTTGTTTLHEPGTVTVTWPMPYGKTAVP